MKKEREYNQRENLKKKIRKTFFTEECQIINGGERIQF